MLLMWKLIELKSRKGEKASCGPAPRNMSESDISGFRIIEYRDFGVRGQSCMLSQLANS
jgi:hypothetical protein